MSGFSRVFQPENDRKIIKNLLLSHKDYEKIEGRQLSAIKRSNLVDLKSKINQFNTRWNYKGMAALWNPQFLAEFLAIKRAESEQTAGQKLFLTVWLHPILLSIRTCLYCPVFGYKTSDMEIMKNAIVKLDNNIHTITDVSGRNGIETVLHNYFIPDEYNSSDATDSNKVADKVQTAESTILNGNAAIIMPDPELPNSDPKAEPKQEFKPTYFGFNPPRSLPAIKPKPEIPENPKQDSSNNDDDDDDDDENSGSQNPLAENNSGEYYNNYIVACPFFHDMNASNDKCDVYITENHRLSPSTHLVTESEQVSYFIGLPASSRILHIQHKCANYFRLIINNHLVQLRVQESTEYDGTFDSDLDENYLNRLNLTYSPGQNTPRTGVVSEVNISVNAPKLNRSGQNIVDVSDPPPFNLEEDSNPLASIDLSIVSNNDSGIIVRQFERTWKASTPRGIKGGRGKYVPK